MHQQCQTLIDISQEFITLLEHENSVLSDHINHSLKTRKDPDENDSLSHLIERKQMMLERYSSLVEEIEHQHQENPESFEISTALQEQLAQTDERLGALMYENERLLGHLINVIETVITTVAESTMPPQITYQTQASDTAQKGFSSRIIPFALDQKT